MFLTSFFNYFKKECEHDKVVPNVEMSYCPDCGKLIKNEWYITRCACCGIKLKSVIRGAYISPLDRFCTNCGSEEYIVEKLDAINFINIQFAVHKKSVVKEFIQANSTQCWQEKSIEQPKLLALCQ